MPSYVVTGANRNIGLALITNLSANPDNLVIALNRSAFDEPLPPNVREVRGTIGDLASMQSAVTQIKEITGGSLDVLILNAAQGQLAHVPIGEGKEQELGDALLQSFTSNTVGNIQLISLLLPLLRRGKGKKIVHMTSAHGVHDRVLASGLIGRLPYGVAKSALDLALARISNELKPEGFTVFSISPSTVNTRENAAKHGIDFDALHAMLSKQPGFSGIYSPEEGAQLLLDTIHRFGPEDSGRVVGMWGTEDRWA